MLLKWYFWIGVGALLICAAATLVRRAKRVAKVCAFLPGILGATAFLVGAYLAWWYAGRAKPLDRDLFTGIRHVRVVLTEPRHIVVNLLFINLKQEGIAFVVSEPDATARPNVRASTVGNFLERAGVQVAMNANFFHPFHSNSPWDFYPHAGDPVEVLGIAASKGDLYSTQAWLGATMYLSTSNQVQLGGTMEKIWNAVAGDQWLVRDGKVVAKPDAFGFYPRASAAVNAPGDILILAVVDGKQPGFSEGMSLPEFAELLKARGAQNAINLDGGGSVTLVAANENSRAVALNSPIHTRIPGRQRPVGNQLGVRVER